MVNIAQPPFPWRRYTLITVAIAGVCTAAYFGCRHQYNHWRGGRLARQAGAFFGKKDFPSAALSAQRGLTFDPDSVACWKVLSEVTEVYRRPEALYARMRVVELEKHSLDSVSRFVSAALRLGEPQAAADALAGVSEPQRQSATYAALRGDVGTALGKWDIAIDGYTRAVQLEPTNDHYRLAQATAMLDQGWIENRTTARATLERLSTRSEFRLPALRSLLKDSLANGEITGLVEGAHELSSAPSAGFAEKITLLDIVHHYDKAHFPELLQTLQTEAHGDVSQTLDLAFWLNRNGLYAEAIAWADTFSPEEWNNPQICAAFAIDFLGAKNWPRLRKFTEPGGWQALDYFRLALLSRAIREQGNFTLFQTTWNAAIAAAAEFPRASGQLARLIADWGMEEQYVDLLRALIKDPKEAGWASQTLLPILARRRDTQGLWLATGRYIQANAGNDAATNNYAMYSLLLGWNATRGGELAAQLYARHPREGQYVSTYAYSLHVRHRTEEGLQAIETLSSEQLESPDVAVYYGILLAGTAHWARAPKYLGVAPRAVLLPEEQALIRAAGAQVEGAAANTLLPVLQGITAI